MQTRISEFSQRFPMSEWERGTKGMRSIAAANTASVHRKLPTVSKVVRCRVGAAGEQLTQHSRFVILLKY